MGNHKNSRHAGIALVANLALAWFLFNAPPASHAEILTPPYFNLAEGKEIIASATCGVDYPGPELYCQLVGANSDQEQDINVIQGQVCDVCDPNVPGKSHPPEHAVDGMETWWQSPPLSRGKKYEEVNLTINLGQEFHVAYVYVRMANSPRPRLWVLEKSKDYGKSWSPWQYFADSDNDCQTYFGIDSHTPITRDDSVICTTEYSKIVPLEGGEMPISILNNRPSAQHYFNSTMLQEWTRATNVRFRFLKTKNLLGHLMSVKKQDPTVTRRYFYSIKDISIGGRCMCNGHADTCDITDPNQPKTLFCRCQHNTCGPQCATCCRGYEQKKWRQSTSFKKFVCEPCNCFDHSDECEYDESVDEKHLSLDVHGNYEGGGVCRNCKHNTEGINCNHCKPGYYRVRDRPLNATDICQPCQCDSFFSTGNCVDFTGQCECKPEFTSPDCDSCSYGYFGYPNCKPCECHLNGTDGYHCEATEGQCPCKSNYAGHYCDLCAEEYYDFPNCHSCECDRTGAVNNVCEVISGNCTCQPRYGGRKCDMCEDGYYNYPTCSYCECDPQGTEPGICDKSTGQCLCKVGYGGPRCDQCIAGYYGYPNCKPCNCSTNGTTSISCDAGGKCSCMSNFVGRTCNQCAPGYYNYPECTACNCHARGSIGISCDLDGKCQCLENFDGDQCGKCKEGFYNFPTCEGCNCDPAGILETFQGCGSLPAGELCQCKERVEGRICNQCKKLFWNLQPTNPDGCEDCNCYPAGVIGGIKECDGKSGQCLCKPKVEGRDCSTCVDGTYDLQNNNLFGCSECRCDTGGSITPNCDKSTGQCLCRNRIEGKTCKSPMRAQYFPTLHQFQYEAEDAKTINQRPVRYGFAEDLFPGYSWKGYAIFSPLQNIIMYDVEIQKSSLYRMVLRYVNPSNDAILGEIKILPEFSAEPDQNVKVLLKPTKTSAFITASGDQGVTPAVMVLNPGRWTILIQIDRSIFLDYFVLLPSEYYEASILTQDVTIPCKIGYRGLCRHFAYPNLDNFDKAMGTNATVIGASQLTGYFENQETLGNLGEGKMLLLDDYQTRLNFDLPIQNSGHYVLVVTYFSPYEYVNATSTVSVEANNLHRGKVVFYPCRYTTICRQVVTEENGKVAILDFAKNNVSVTLAGDQNTRVAIKSVVAIPILDWSVDYLNPKSVCVHKDGECVQGIFPEAPEAKKIEMEDDNQIGDKGVTPLGIYDKNIKHVQLGGREMTYDVHGQVDQPGEYVLVVQYYQPDYPEYELDVLVQNGKDYEAEVPMSHCPSNGNCRSVIRSMDGNSQFQLADDFVLTFKADETHNAWIDYVLVVPAEHYNEEILKKLQFDQTKEFIRKCTGNHFYVNTSDTGFCRESVYSLTTQYNSGALPCHCDSDGSRSYECDKFGGQCACRPNIVGRRCNICKTGFYGFPDCRPCSCPSVAVCEPETGACICPSRVVGEMCDRCEIGTYGYDPINGCEECSCSPYGVQNNDLQCDLFTGNCNCKPHVVGRQCDKCKSGHYGFPYCTKCFCDLAGTIKDICDQETSECFCKANVQGFACELCKDGMFNLQASNPKGCTECFCFGKTTRCTSAQLYRTQIMDMHDWEIVKVNEKNETVEILESIPVEMNETMIQIRPSADHEDMHYFSAPESYLKKKLSSYGGWLNYTIFYINGPDGRAVPGADVILQGPESFLIHRSEEQPPDYQNYFASVQLVETNFESRNGPATHEQIMTVLGDLRGIYIRGTYVLRSLTVSLSHVSLDVAVDNPIPGAEIATSVEQCQCPPNYKGLSCEECAEGYYRVQSGPYGGSCVKCQCNGHADSCDITTGICLNCQHGTIGDHCEMCQQGYYGNATYGTPHDCLICACPMPIPSNNFAKGCVVSDDGSQISCDCLPGYYGALCNSCAAGFYGNPNNEGEYCKPCECSGNIDTNAFDSCDSVTGECLRCLNNTYGEACNLCAPGYYGDAVSKKDCRSCFCNSDGMKSCDSYNGICVCHENVVGETCDQCEVDHYGFSTRQGCKPCNCGIASESTQCSDDGQCKCKPGVEGRACDRCIAGYWNYGPDGCISCGCTTGYSRGTSCNPETGQCECLPKVLGEKCDHCPHRHVLDPRRGCESCDKCLDDLLDVTDDLERILVPATESFRDVATTHFTLQRLEFFNNSIENLSPQVEAIDPRRGESLDPLNNKIANLDVQTYQLKKSADYNDEEGLVASNTADERLKAANALNEEVSREIKWVNHVVSQVQSLAANIDSHGGGPKISNALREAQDNLERIKQVDFQNPRDKATQASSDANGLLTSMMEFAKPLNTTEDMTKGVNSKLGDLNSRINDFRNFTHQVDELSRAVELLVLQNKKATDPATIEAINTDADKSKENIVAGEKYVQDGSKALEDAENNFNDLRNEAGSGLSEESINLATKVEENENILNHILQSSVPHAVAHARELQRDSEILKASVDRTKMRRGVQASSAYEDISTKIESANVFAQDANDAATNAVKMTDGLENRAQAAREESENLLNSANEASDISSNKLKPALMRYGQHENDAIDKLNQQNEEILDKIKKSLDTLPVTSSGMTSKEATNIADKVEYIVTSAENSLRNYAHQIPEDLKTTKQLSKDTSEANKDISQGGSQVNSLRTLVPTIMNKLQYLDDVQKAINRSRNSLYDSIADLKKKIASARELANRFNKHGLHFFSNTTLELRNPEGLASLATATQLSFYVRTPKTNGFLMYLGNEHQPNAVRFKSEDFIALSVENGYPVVTLDFGSGPHRLIGKHYISDNVWRKITVDRTGKNIKLIVREQTSDGGEIDYAVEDELPGTHAIFDLDQEKSKLFVGGFPASFQMQDAVISSSFEGEIEELEIGQVPVSFWDFIDGENNSELPKPRGVLLRLDVNTGYRFDNRGYAVLSKQNTPGVIFEPRKFIIQFNFKTYSKDGVMFLIEDNNKHFLSLEMRDGHVLYQFDIGSGTFVVLKSPEKYNDGNWHNVEVRRLNNVGTFYVDGHSLGSQTRGSGSVMTSPEYLYFGGYPSNLKMPYPVIHKSFEGCIDGVKIHSTEIDLTKNVEVFGVKGGCYNKVTTLVSFDDLHPGHVRWDNVEVPGPLQISLKFKTTAENGLLYHLINPDGNSISTLSLQDGRLVLESQGHKVATNPEEIRFTDNNWHVVTATHKDTTLRLDIDDIKEEILSNVPTPQPVSDGFLYIGNFAKAHPYGPFMGCIGHMTLNGKIVNFANSTEKPHAQLDYCPIADLGSRDDVEPPLVTYPPPPQIEEEHVPNVIDIGQGEDSVQTPSPSEGRPVEPEHPVIGLPESSVTTTTIKPDIVDGCRLPSYPADDPDSEEAWRFGTEQYSRFEYYAVNSMLKERYIVKMDVKPLGSDGVIFFAGDTSKRDFIGVFMQEGKVYYTFDCGSGPALIASDIKINNYQWHSIEFRRDFEHGELYIDDESLFSGNSQGNTKTINIDSAAFIGGLSPEILSIANSMINVTKPFSGCIRNIVVNNLNLDDPDYETGVIPCSKRMEPGLFFYPGNGSNWYRAADKFQVGREIEIHMDIKPRSTSGLLMTIHGKKEYLVLEMINNTIFFLMKTNRGQVETTFDKKEIQLCDGNWHNIKATKRKNTVLISVDNSYSDPGIGRGSKQIQMANKLSIYIGGHPLLDSGQPLRGSVSQAQFVGCMNNVIIRSESYTDNIDLSRLHGRVLGGICPTI